MSTNQIISLTDQDFTPLNMDSPLMKVRDPFLNLPVGFPSSSSSMEWRTFNLVLDFVCCASSDSCSWSVCSECVSSSCSSAWSVNVQFAYSLTTNYRPNPRNEMKWNSLFMKRLATCLQICRFTRSSSLEELPLNVSLFVYTLQSHFTCLQLSMLLVALSDAAFRCLPMSSDAF